jgi:hypothetical protein
MADSEDDRSGQVHETVTDPDPLKRLEERLDRASEAAERLIAEAAAAAIRKPPPSGWQRREPDGEAADGPEATSGEGARSGGKPGGDRATASDAVGEIELLLEAARALRDRIPPELQRRLGEALREVLLALRALIDWYLERTERQRQEPTEARDIPIV